MGAFMNSSGRFKPSDSVLKVILNLAVLFCACEAKITVDSVKKASNCSTNPSRCQVSSFTVTLTSAVTSTSTTNSSTEVTAKFSDAYENFELSAIESSNAILSNLRKDGSTATFTATAISAGQTSVKIPANKVKSTRAIWNTVSNELAYTYTPITNTPTPQAIIVQSVTSSKPNATYGVGVTIDIAVTFTSAVTVTGTPQLTLETGTTDHAASYSSGSGSTTLTFSYHVQSGDTSADLDYQSTTALTLNGGTIAGSSGEAVTLTLPTLGTYGSLGYAKAIVINTGGWTNPTLRDAIIGFNPRFDSQSGFAEDQFVASGSQQATNSSVSLVDDGGLCYSFSGSTSSYLSVASAMPVWTGIGFWMKTSTTGSLQVMIDGYDPSSDRGLLVAVDTNGSVGIDGRNGAGTYRSSGYSTQSMTDGQWHFVFGQYNGTKLQIYVDGTLRSEAAFASGFTTRSDLNIGGFSNSGVPSSLTYTGKLDEVTFWNRPLSAAEVTTLYNNGTRQAVYAGTHTNKSVQNAVFGLNANRDFIAKDQVGNRDGTLVNGTYRTESKGLLAYSFDGTNDYISIPAFNPTGANGQQLSVFGWVNAGTGLANDAQFIAQYDTSTSSRAWEIGIVSNRRSLQVVLSSDGSTNVKQYETTSTTVFNDTWRHVGFTWNAGTLTLYVDGVAQSVTQTQDASFTSISNFTAPITVGARILGTSPTVPALGLVDDVALYGRVLSSSEITALASARRSMYSTSSLLDAKLVLSADRDSNISTSSLFAFDQFTTEGTQTCSLQTGMTRTYDAGYAYSFNGTSDRISVSSLSLPASGDWSVSFWFKTSQTAEGTSLSNYAVQAGSLDFKPTSSSSGWKPKLTVGGSFSLVGTADKNDNSWHHYAATRFGNVFTLYIDGVSQGNTTNAATISTNNLYIGGRPIGDNNQAYAGSLDDILVYQRALSASEVATLATQRGAVYSN
jgi:hypothetical protein